MPLKEEGVSITQSETLITLVQLLIYLLATVGLFGLHFGLDSSVFAVSLRLTKWTRLGSKGRCRKQQLLGLKSSERDLYLISPHLYECPGTANMTSGTCLSTKVQIQLIVSGNIFVCRFMLIFPGKFDQYTFVGNLVFWGFSF